MGLLSNSDADHGHLRVTASDDGMVTSLEVVAPLSTEEIGPALHEVYKALAPRTREQQQLRLQAHKKAVLKKAGVLDKLRGKAGARLEAAEVELPTSVYEGNAGAVTIYVDGALGFVKLQLTAAIGFNEAAALTPDALEVARVAALAAWEHAVLDDAEAEEVPS